MTATRNTQSKAKIRAAFVSLMNAKGFDAMTVSDLAREAGINRGTFYMHYIDKYDLRQQLLEEEIATLSRIVLDGADGEPSCLADYIPYDAILAALTHIKQEYAFFWATSDQGKDMELYVTVKRILTTLIVGRTLGPGVAIGTETIPQPYAEEILVSSTTSIIWLWLCRGCKESPRTVADIIEASKGLSPMALLE